MDKKYWYGIASVCLMALLFFYRKRTRSMKASYLNRPDLPRGIRNNNPGNIRINKQNDWLGKIRESQNTDGSFEQFIEFRYGVRAMILLIKGDIERRGIYTLQALLNKYAPASENNTGNYIRLVANGSGFSPSTPLSTDKESLRRIVQAMSKVENGRAITDEEFEYGYNLI
jgi:hypothetical protein